MSFWKFGLCLAILAVALSHQKALDSDDLGLGDIELRGLMPNLGQQLFSKEDLQEIVDTLRSTKKDEEHIVNEHVDKALQKLNQQIISQGKDPVPMPDQGFEFEYRVVLITYSGEMTLKNGWLQGLATLERVKDCTLSSDGTTMTLKLSLTFKKLMFNYDYRCKFMGLGPKGGIDGKISNSRFTGTFLVDVQTLQAELDTFKLDKAGSLDIRFTGNVLTDWLLNILSDVTTTFLKPVLRIFISGWVLDGCNVVLAVYNELICNVVGACPNVKIIL